MFPAAPLIRVLADQAKARASRRATVLPLIVNMGTSAICAELRLRTDESEKVFDLLGLGIRSPLRQVAERLPLWGGRAADLAVHAGNAYAQTMVRAADILERGRPGSSAQAAGA